MLTEPLKFSVNETLIKSELIKSKKIVLTEKFTMNKFEDAFEEKNYERVIKENFSDIILDKIIFYLFKVQ